MFREKMHLLVNENLTEEKKKMTELQIRDVEGEF